MAETSQQSPSSITGANLEEERDAVEPQGDGDGSGLDTVPVDGRISGLPPNYDEADGDTVGGEADSPALDAEVQSEARRNNPDGDDETGE